MEIKPIIKDFLEKEGIQSFEKSHIAINELKNIDDEVVLSGNKLGLIMLADYILNVALSGVKGFYVHLAKDNFFDVSYKQLIIKLLEDNQNFIHCC